MTSTLPNFSANTAAPAAGSKSISSADLKSAGAAPCEHEGSFDDLMPPPKEKTPDKPVEASSSSPSSIQAMSVNAADEVASVEAADDSTKEVSQDTLEQAAAFVAGLMQMLLPEVTVPALAGGAAAKPVAVTPELPGAAQAVAAGATAAATQVGEGATAAKSETASTENFQVAYAADGAVEIKLDLPTAKTANGKADASATSVEIKAELELPGQAVMRLEANGSFTPGGDGQTGQANFAVKKGRTKTGLDSVESTGERNFVSTADERVKTRSSESGITVAKSEATMSLSTFDEARATSNQVTHVGLPARGEFTVAWPSAEKTAEVAVAAPVENNFAERAVATVTGLVDAQFSASMQKSGSVQLKLKFGGEDLSVRVELRDGSVHTDFKTDSAELRAALTREMQAVANASPDQLRRYAEPVFSPSSSGDSQQQPGRQSAAQQDLSQQQQRMPRSQQEEMAPFARRSLLRETFFPEPVAPRAPALLPTSLRLSALA